MGSEKFSEGISDQRVEVRNSFSFFFFTKGRWQGKEFFEDC